jgi:hypothetical protein
MFPSPVSQPPILVCLTFWRNTLSCCLNSAVAGKVALVSNQDVNGRETHLQAQLKVSHPSLRSMYQHVLTPSFPLCVSYG